MVYICLSNLSTLFFFSINLYPISLFISFSSILIFFLYISISLLVSLLYISSCSFISLHLYHSYFPFSSRYIYRSLLRTLVLLHLTKKTSSLPNSLITSFRNYENLRKTLLSIFIYEPIFMKIYINVNFVLDGVWPLRSLKGTKGHLFILKFTFSSVTYFFEI